MEKLSTKYKNEEVEELIFYFSGHGEKEGDEFLYLPSDFDPHKKLGTSISNDRIDTLIKEISPKLTIKVVDACHSGTTYVKNQDNTQKILEKAAAKKGLNSLYFLFSSGSQEYSYAGSDFSHFTESFLTAILESHGETGYLDIINRIKDFFITNKNQTPHFIQQGTGTEKIGNINEETKNLINKAFGLSDEEHKTSLQNISSTFDQLLQKIQEKTTSECFKEEDLGIFLDKFKTDINNWDSSITNFFTPEYSSKTSPEGVPNCEYLGSWLEDNKEICLFAEPEYSIEYIETSQYVQKPFQSLSSAEILASCNDPLSIYNLEIIKKPHNKICGFLYTHNTGNNIISIKLSPKYEILNPVCIYIVSFYSNKNIVIHYSHEELKKINWEKHSLPKCEEWYTVIANFNVKDSISTSIQRNITNWLLSLINRKIR